MELSQLLDRIRTQCDRLSLTGLSRVPDDRHPGLAAGPNQAPCSAAGPSRFGATLRPRAHGGSLPQLNAEEAAWAQVNLGGTALREARAELAEARKQWHCLQVEIESLHALVSTHTHTHTCTDTHTHHHKLSIAADKHPWISRVDQ
ncbi:unnamed protein product [Oncorhynchus mykiss]|uniref:Uncharacterized protein n=1 Tax=Oncorhynchus mykiss TaxID=8022 RepID=A0A060WUM6_ONCMY|nr:unnamed protein product [Oncorhynchus mykiss]